MIRRNYRTPRLTAYGNMEALTQGGEATGVALTAGLYYVIHQFGDEDKAKSRQRFTTFSS